MSKSLGARHYLGLFEDETSIRRKIRAAVTDPGGAGAEPSPGVENLFRILAETAPSVEHERLERARKEGSLRYVDLKEAVADHLVAALRPLRARAASSMIRRARTPDPAPQRTGLLLAGRREGDVGTPRVPTRAAPVRPENAEATVISRVSRGAARASDSRWVQPRWGSLRPS
jgi:tRNA synthetases class I (W and Y)